MEAWLWPCELCGCCGCNCRYHGKLRVCRPPAETRIPGTLCRCHCKGAYALDAIGRFLFGVVMIGKFVVAGVVGLLGIELDEG